MVGCSGYPQCRTAVWLPGSVAEAAVTPNVCTSCLPGPVYMIQFKFRRLEIPADYNVNHLGCIGGCDETLRQLIEICGTGSRISARGRGSSASSGSAQRSNNRQAACIYCQQMGHLPSACPSQIQPRGVTIQNARVWGSSVSSGSARRSNSRQAACIYCQQMGHISSACPSQAQPRGVTVQNGEPSIPCSTCGMPCVMRTANTANNRGRKFYSCQSRHCNFFTWEDNLNNGARENNAPRGNINSSSSNPNRRGGQGRGGHAGARAADTMFVSATGDQVSGARCFVCGDPSHYANACPNRGG